MESSNGDGYFKPAGGFRPKGQWYGDRMTGGDLTTLLLAFWGPLGVGFSLSFWGLARRFDRQDKKIDAVAEDVKELSNKVDDLTLTVNGHTILLDVLQKTLDRIEDPRHGVVGKLEDNIKLTRDIQALVAVIADRQARDGHSPVQVPGVAAPAGQSNPLRESEAVATA